MTAEWLCWTEEGFLYQRRTSQNFIMLPKVTSNLKCINYLFLGFFPLIFLNCGLKHMPIQLCKVKSLTASVGNIINWNMMNLAISLWFLIFVFAWGIRCLHQLLRVNSCETFAVWMKYFSEELTIYYVEIPILSGHIYELFCLLSNRYLFFLNSFHFWN